LLRGIITKNPKPSNAPSQIELVSFGTKKWLLEFEEPSMLSFWHQRRAPWNSRSLLCHPLGKEVNLKRNCISNIPQIIRRKGPLGINELAF